MGDLFGPEVQKRFEKMMMMMMIIIIILEFMIMR